MVHKNFTLKEDARGGNRNRGFLIFAHLYLHSTHEGVNFDFSLNDTQEWSKSRLLLLLSLTLEVAVNEHVLQFTLSSRGIIKFGIPVLNSLPYSKL